MTHSSINEAMANAVGSASFLLTAVALLLTAIAIALGAWANWKAKQAEVETTRLELSYRLMLAAAGGGDARLQGELGQYYSGMEVQAMAIAALRAFPENLDVYERLLAERTRIAAENINDVRKDVLRQETWLLVQAVKVKRGIS